LEQGSAFYVQKAQKEELKEPFLQALQKIMGLKTENPPTY
jgi:hypothetical protein